MSQEWDDRMIDEALAALPVYDADPARIRRIQTRCQAALDCRRERMAARDRGAFPWLRRLESVAAVGIGILYLTGVIERVLYLLS